MPSPQYSLALITGASSGIGAACAEKFVQEGMKVILAARRSDQLNAIATDLRQRYQANIHAITLDVTDHEAVKHAIADLPQEWQSIDILVNNAGLAAGIDTFQEAHTQDWENMIDTNIKGLLYVTREVLPQMIARHRGHIINMGSVAGHQTYKGGAVYCATKAAVNRINEGLRLDINGSGVRATSIDPGMVDSAFSLVRFRGDAQRAKSVYQGMTPLKPADVADAIWYCVSCPPHVNIAEMLIYPTDQAAATVVHRRE
jgi:3-hydroxy acid dehydrogenase / malonic semialdehyde reductase